MKRASGIQHGGRPTHGLPVLSKFCASNTGKKLSGAIDGKIFVL
ncbi:MAG: hypothetical protein ACRDFB_05425 [Rhabdochlamydiaceae bacterium]